MGKVTSSRSRKQRHDPLLKDLDSAQGTLRRVQETRASNNADDEDDREEFIDSSTSRKILQLAKEQQDEIADEEDKEAQDAEINSARFKSIQYDDADFDEEDEQEVGNISDFEPDEEYAEEEEVEMVEIDEEDNAMFEQYFKGSGDYNAVNGSYNLADKIMASIKEKEMEYDES